MPIERELNWGWPEICVTLFWKLCPLGVVIQRSDLIALPMERVMLEDRSPTEIRFSWITLREAKIRATTTKLSKEKAGVSELQGRWQKIACVLLWKFCKDGCVLTPGDRAAVPGHLILLAHGHRDDIEYRFVLRAEAERIQKWERDNEGHEILEVMKL